MINNILLNSLKRNSTDIVVSSLAIILILIIPSISHLLNFPLYRFEPMRLVLILSLVHLKKTNVYILAISLPLFSYLLSGHPLLIKALIMSVELFINVWLFYAIFPKLKNVFLSVFSSIILSKLIYYGFKLALLETFLIEGSLVSTPLQTQFFVSITVSVYAMLFSKKISTQLGL